MRLTLEVDKSIQIKRGFDGSISLQVGRMKKKEGDNSSEVKINKIIKCR